MSNFFQTYRSNPKSLLEHDLNYLSQPPVAETGVHGVDDMLIDSNTASYITQDDVKNGKTDVNVNHFFHPSQFVDTTTQRIRLYTECFTVPEALFSPDSKNILTQ